MDGLGGVQPPQGVVWAAGRGRVFWCDLLPPPPRKQCSDLPMVWDNNDDKVVRPAWAVGAFLRGARCMMIMKIMSPFGQLGLWAPSSGVRDV
jgi:hypothetical protein